MANPDKTELNARDWSIVQYFADGWRIHEIAKEVGVTHGVMKNQISRMYDIAGVWTQPEIVAKGFREKKLL